MLRERWKMWWSPSFRVADGLCVSENVGNFEMTFLLQVELDLEISSVYCYCTLTRISERGSLKWGENVFVLNIGRDVFKIN